MKTNDSPFIIRCFVMIDDQKVEFNPNEFDSSQPQLNELSEKCKLALAEMVTGQKCCLVESDS